MNQMLWCSDEHKKPLWYYMEPIILLLSFGGDQTL